MLWLNQHLPYLRIFLFPSLNLIKDQKLYSTLQKLFESVLSEDEIRKVANGYLLQDGMLMRKGIPHGKYFAGDPTIQVVVPVKYRSIVLQTFHDEVAGHLGVKKTYDQILRYFFWPKLKKKYF